ncbi:MAG: hypothetical protein O3A46_16150 [Candidatus Poribacteria bacterium]|nr:hypothetical protein [Candidatus Poribacteria bacterium]
MVRRILTVALCSLGLSVGAVAQDVAIMFDGGLSVLGVPDAPGFAQMLVNELGDRGVDAAIVNAAGLLDYMNANPEGIFLVSQGVMPGTIFQNKGKADPIYNWLRDGGIGGFVGDYPFYYWANVAAGAGQVNVFGVTVTNGTVTNVVPTALGKEYMPSLEDWISNRPVGLATLTNNNFEFESYADNTVNADPIAFRTEDMGGWFINFHTSCCGTNVPPNDRMAASYAELISNRFVDAARAVHPEGKAGVTWGEMKKRR